ncbi:MAG: hypothetical protein WAV41_00745 [Microgenomates group bacterium]
MAKKLRLVSIEGRGFRNSPDVDVIDAPEFISLRSPKSSEERQMVIGSEAVAVKRLPLSRRGFPVVEKHGVIGPDKPFFYDDRTLAEMIMHRGRQYAVVVKEEA